MSIPVTRWKDIYQNVNIYVSILDVHSSFAECIDRVSNLPHLRLAFFYSKSGYIKGFHKNLNHCILCRNRYAHVKVNYAHFMYREKMTNSAFQDKSNALSLKICAHGTSHVYTHIYLLGYIYMCVLLMSLLSTCFPGCLTLLSFGLLELCCLLYFQFLCKQYIFC